MGELFLERVGVGVGRRARQVHVERGVDAVEDKGFALGVKDKDILVFFGGAGAGVGIFPALVGEREVVGAATGGRGFYFGGCGGSVGGESWFVVV